MKSASIWKSMSLAWKLYFGCPLHGALTPRLRLRRAPALACQRLYLESLNASPNCSHVAFSPTSSSTLVNVISTYKSSWSMALLMRSGVHFNSPSMILPLDLNSVGAPNETPIICPAHPPLTLSFSAAWERRRVLFWAVISVVTSANAPRTRREINVFFMETSQSTVQGGVATWRFRQARYTSPPGRYPSLYCSSTSARVGNEACAPARV